ncbi:MAG: hypothetical protein A2021_01390 [Elusimicrobia bacterium GWF2_52_66]|nr:MAG: hypothetical protein A2X33_01605 [Elusimicrobia bacterium GWA2_51_34]OGR85303.1 MAG: hypothetical protein A2021_01390 [Elusimicrobia bacterium GWF2_52_66]HAF96224.1 hypothetical protein [Elusimicrobiota bacterium]HCE97835.1 hypothetical protein [Elusimicrobiota bacterium]
MAEVRFFMNWKTLKTTYLAPLFWNRVGRLITRVSGIGSGCWAKRAGLAALAAGLSVYGLCAQEQAADEAFRLQNYEARISSADLAAADSYLKDFALLDKLAVSDPVKAADLRSKAEAVVEYGSLLDRNWPASQERNLSEAMALRLTDQSPLAKVGLAPEPEKTLAWAAEYKNYGAAKTALLKRSVRNWDAIFAGLTFSPRYRYGALAAWEVTDSTGSRFMQIVDGEVVFKNSEADMKAFWATLTLRERNNYMNLKAGQLLDGLIGSPSGSDSAYAAVALRELLSYLDGPGYGRLKKYIAQMAAVEIARPEFSPGQLAKLKDQPIEQQLYLLGRAFDKSEIRGAVAAERKIDSLRQSQPGETLSPLNNQMLASMLGSAMIAEVRGTVAGDKLAKFYAAGAKLNVAIESCQGCYAKYESSSGRMILDSELIQQYMRVNNLTANTLLGSREQVSSLSKYLSPMLAHEGTHQMQHAWADRARVYKPYVQEDEVEANAMEALYTMEKLKNDPKFKSMMTRMRTSSSSYAAKRLALASAFSSNTNEFDSRVRQVYYPGLPSFVAASSQVVSAVSGELNRRSGLLPADLAEIEKTGIGTDEAKAMTTQELSGSVGEIQTAALQKIQEDLLRGNFYGDYYQNAGDWTGSMRQAVKTAAAGPKSKVPAL